MKRRILLALAALFLLPFLFPERKTMPVDGATVASWNARSFWYEPWGRSGVHKGIDVFAAKGTTVRAPVDGVVVFAGELPMGGTVVLVLGPRWRLHYLAHLDRRDVGFGRPVLAGTAVGGVGDSGNAKGKPPHLHYALATLVPYPWRVTGETQGWKKMFFLDPGAWLLR